MERMHVPRREMNQVLGLEVEEVENGALDVSQVIVKYVTGVGCSLLEVTGEVQLCAQVASGLLLSLVAAPVPKISGRLQVTPRHFPN
jgi:hypothetical protein